MPFSDLICFALQEKWSALYDVRSVLLSIQSLLSGESCIIVLSTDLGWECETDRQIQNCDVQCSLDQSFEVSCIFSAAIICSVSKVEEGEYH